MRVRVIGKIVLVTAILSFLGLAWLASLPWFSWYLQKPEQQRAVITEASLPWLNQILDQSQAEPPLIGQGERVNFWRENFRQISLIRWASAWKQTAQIILVDGAPFRPHAIFNLPASLLDSRNEGQLITVVLAQVENELLISGTIRSKRIWVAPPVKPELSASHQLTLTAPGYIFSFLPPTLAIEWNNLLLASFGFTKTEPNLVEFISQFELVEIKLGQAQPLLAVKGAADAFRMAVTEWLQEEERHYRLVDKYFALPDGSLGREKVPAEPRTLFENSTEVCQQADFTELPFWFCHSENVAALSTSKFSPTDLFSPETSAWEIYFTIDKLNASCTEQSHSLLCGFQEIVAKSDGTTFQARLIKAD